MVNKHTNLINHGVVQVFNYPHPRRLPILLRPSMPIQSSSETKPPGADLSSAKDQSLIVLPKGLYLTDALETVENLYKFSLKTFRQLPPQQGKEVSFLQAIASQCQ